MASILISEADPDVRRLLVVLMTRLGHEAIVFGRGAAVPPRCDLLLLEPASSRCVSDARLARLFYPELPIVCMGALQADGAFLADGPLTLLEKPFTVEALEAVVAEFLPSLV